MRECECRVHARAVVNGVIMSRSGRPAGECAAAGHALVIWCRGGVREQSARTVLVTTFALHGWSSGSVAGCPAVFPGGHSRCLFRVLADLREPKISQLSRALFWPVGLTKKNKSSRVKMGGNAQFDPCRCHPGAGTGIDAPPQCPHADQLSRWPHQHRRAGPSATANGTLEV